MPTGHKMTAFLINDNECKVGNEPPKSEGKKMKRIWNKTILTTLSENHNNSKKRKLNLFTYLKMKSIG